MQILLPALGWQKSIYKYKHVFASWITFPFGPYLPSLAFALVFVLLWWLIVYAMDRRRIYLKL